VEVRGFYLIVRTSITTNRQVLRCLRLSVGAGSIVAVLAILQSLQLFGVPRLLATYYAPFGYTGALDHARGSSTLALARGHRGPHDLQPGDREWAAATRRGHRLLLCAAGRCFALGALSPVSSPALSGWSSASAASPS